MCVILSLKSCPRVTVHRALIPISGQFFDSFIDDSQFCCEYGIASRLLLCLLKDHSGDECGSKTLNANMHIKTLRQMMLSQVGQRPSIHIADE